MADNVALHVCAFCEKCFRKQSQLIVHERSHTDERPFECEFEGCDKQFKRVDHLRRHERMSHMPSAEQFRCEEDGCEAVFRSHQSLKKHVRRSHALDTYKCTKAGCGEVFRKHHQLTLHRLAHAQTDAFICKEPGCGKTFPCLSRLKRHEKTHRGYQCKEDGCAMVFSKWSLWVTHNRTAHSTGYVCDVCEKTFAQKQWLKQHKLTHEESRRVFTCTHENCEREYLDQRNLNAHIRSYHDNKRFACEHEGCGQTFATKQKQCQHMKLHDPSRPPVRKKARKKKSLAEKLTGDSMETEVRCPDSDNILRAPTNEDSVDFSEFPDMQVAAEHFPEMHLTQSDSTLAKTKVTESGDFAATDKCVSDCEIRAAILSCTDISKYPTPLSDGGATASEESTAECDVH